MEIFETALASHNGDAFLRRPSYTAVKPGNKFLLEIRFPCPCVVTRNGMQKPTCVPNVSAAARSEMERELAPKENAGKRERGEAVGVQNETWACPHPIGIAYEPAAAPRSAMNMSIFCRPAQTNHVRRVFYAPGLRRINNLSKLQ